MTKYLLTVDYNGGAIETPMTDWAAEDIKAHMDYYRALDKELTDSGELVENHALTGPELAKVVTSDGSDAWSRRCRHGPTIPAAGSVRARDRSGASRPRPGGPRLVRPIPRHGNPMPVGSRP